MRVSCCYNSSRILAKVSDYESISSSVSLNRIISDRPWSKKGKKELGDCSFVNLRRVEVYCCGNIFYVILRYVLLDVMLMQMNRMNLILEISYELVCIIISQTL